MKLQKGLATDSETQVFGTTEETRLILSLEKTANILIIPKTTEHLQTHLKFRSR